LTMGDGKNGGKGVTFIIEYNGGEFGWDGKSGGQRILRVMKRRSSQKTTHNDTREKMKEKGLCSTESRK